MFPNLKDQTCFHAKKKSLNWQTINRHALCCMSFLWYSQLNSSIVSDGPCFSPLFFLPLFGLLVSYWDFWGWKQSSLRHTHTYTQEASPAPVELKAIHTATGLGVLETPIWPSGASHTWLTPLSHINTLSTHPDMLCQWKVPPHQIFSGPYWRGGTRGKQ